MNLIRKYKISKIINKPLIGVEQEIILLIKSWMNDLVPFEMDEYPNNIFYMNIDNKCILKKDTMDNTFSVRYNGVWEVLSNKYKFEYIDTHMLLKFMIEDAFKIQISDINYGIGSAYIIEEEFQKRNTKINEFNS